MYPGVAVARGRGCVDSIWRVGLGESCTHTCAGCRNNEERPHERTQKLFSRVTGEGNKADQVEHTAVQPDASFARVHVSAKTGTPHHVRECIIHVQFYIHIVMLYDTW